MNTRTLTFFFCLACLASGCGQSRQHSEEHVPLSPPVRTNITAGLDSSAAFTRLLEQRWPLESIRMFCIPERRYNVMYQRPVLDPPFMDGVLYADKETGFDRVAWRAHSANGRVSEFDLAVTSGTNIWVLEGGSVERLEKPPSVTPDPHDPWFVGHN